MSGDVIHQDITILSGAFIDGHCRPDYGKAQAAKSAPALKPVGTFESVSADKHSGAVVDPVIRATSPSSGRGRA